jgi:hypothetical protein
VNTGDLPEEACAMRNPAEVRAAIVASASCGEDGAPVAAERTRVTTGGAKGGRKANASSERPNENPPPAVPGEDKQGGEDLWHRHKAQRGVWSEKMLVALEKGVKVKRVWIPKPGSAERRPLGMPTVRDRVVQTALRMVIEPIFEREFAEESFGFRPGRGCQDALRRVDGLRKSGHVHVVDVDIR